MGVSRRYDGDHSQRAAGRRTSAGTPPVSGRGRLPVRALLGGVALLGALVGAAVARGQATVPSYSHAVRAVRAVGLTVSSLERSIDFYTRVLAFAPVAEPAEVWGPEYHRRQGIFGLRMRVARLRLGDETLELYEYLTPRGRPMPVDSRSNDRWFQHVAIIVGDMDRAYRHLRAHGVEHVSPAPQRLPDWNANAGGIRAFYFKDPDGHPLEILQFPADKGDPKWRRAGDRLFLGIDHTAIVVADTERSLRCYRDALGLRVTGASENYGPEQEYLNQVFGARLRITALRAQGDGPGIEFLEYLAPRDGRPRPTDVRPNDLVHGQTVLQADDLEAVVRALRGSACALASPDVATAPEPALGFRKGALVADPDGHALELVEP
jgi:catechol 2,3-dioxygenase-like lactoylglutathione lyase family enzyme